MVKDGRVDNEEGGKILKILGDMEGSKISKTTLNWCTGQVIMSILLLLDLDHYLVFKVDKWIY